MTMTSMVTFSINQKKLTFKMLSLLFVALAGMLNAIMDLCGKFDQSIFSKISFMRSFMDTTASWKNKYKNGDKSQGSRFFLSTKAFVFLTDMWHLCKTLMLLFLSLAIVFYVPILTWYIDALIFWILFGTAFTVFYDYLFRLKPYWTNPW